MSAFPQQGRKKCLPLGPGSWPLGPGTVTPLSTAQSPELAGDFEIIQPCLSVYGRSGTDAGRSWLSKVTAPGRGVVGTVEKVRTREPGQQAPGPGLQLPGMRLRAMGQPLSLSFHSWKQGGGQLPSGLLGAEQC